MTFEQWASRFSTGVTPALAVLQQCEETCVRQWAPALVAHADQLRAASTALSRWVEENPCPIGDIGLELAQAARSYANAADVLQESIGTGTTWLAVTREIQLLHREMTDVLGHHYQAVISARH